MIVTKKNFLISSLVVSCVVINLWSSEKGWAEENSATNMIHQLFKEDAQKTMLEDVTTSKLETLKAQANTLTDVKEKTQALTAINQATIRLQEFTFQGLGDNVFAKLYYHADGSNYCQFEQFARQPHAYIADNYVTLKVTNAKGVVSYSKKIIGSTFYEANTETIPMQEGSILSITLKEPPRFLTNHDETLKQTEKQEYAYIVRNGKLQHMNEQNRFFTIYDNKQTAIGEMAVDFNGGVINITMHQSTASLDKRKLKIKDNNGKVVYELNKNSVKEDQSSHQSVPFKAGYSISFEGFDSTTIDCKDDNGKADSTFSFDQVKEISIEKSSLQEKFYPSKEDLKIYQQAFQQRIGEKNLLAFKKQDDQHQAFIDWLWNDSEALRTYLSAGYASSVLQGDMSSYQYDEKWNTENEGKALEIWQKICQKSEASKSGTNLKVAIATALEFANGIVDFVGRNSIDAVERYQVYESAIDKNLLMSDFYEYDTQEIRNIVNAKITNSDITYLRNYIETEHPELVTREKITTGHSLLTYQNKNPETGADVAGNDFYGPNPTIKEVLKYGGVCGAMSKFSSVLAQIYGVPAFPQSQPGHCCFLYLDSNHHYQIGYDITGWEGTGNYNTTYPFIELTNDLHKTYAQSLQKSERDRLKAQVSDEHEASQALAEAVKSEPLNYLAWSDKINLEVTKMNLEQITKLKAKINDCFANYPKIANYLEDLIINRRQPGKITVCGYAGEERLFLSLTDEHQLNVKQDTLGTILESNSGVFATITLYDKNHIIKKSMTVLVTERPDVVVNALNGQTYGEEDYLEFRMYQPKKLHTEVEGETILETKDAKQLEVFQIINNKLVRTTEEETDKLIAPKVYEIKENDTVIRGQSFSGQTIVVRTNKKEVSRGTIEADGSFNLTISQAKANDSYQITATNELGEESMPTTVTVASDSKPETSQVNVKNITYLLGNHTITGDYTGELKNARLYVNGKSVSWGGTFKDGKFSYLVDAKAIKATDTLILTFYKESTQLVSKDHHVTIKK